MAESIKSVTISKVGARILETQISGRFSRFKPRDSRKWSPLADRLIEAQGEYDRVQEGLTKDIEEVRADPFLSEQERAGKMNQLGTQMNAHDAKEGEERFTIELDAEDVGFLLAQFEQVELPATRQWRKWTRDILDALENATPVKLKAADVTPASDSAAS